MSGQPISTRLLLALAGVVIILLVFVMVSTWTDMFGGDDRNVSLNDSESPAEQPLAPTTLSLDEGSSRQPTSTTSVPQREPDPREAELEAIVETFTNQNPSSNGGSRNNDSGAGDQGSPFSIDDLYAAGLIPAPSQAPTTPPPPPVTDLSATFTPSQQAEYTPVSIGSEEYELEQLNRTRFSDCGTIDVPTGALSQYSLMNNLAQQPTVQCLGRTVAQSCGASEVKVRSADIGGSIYVVKDNDNQCTIGFQVSGEETVTLCDLQTILVAQGVDQEWDAWEDAFRSDPGGMMADIVMDNVQFLLGLSGVSGAGCRVYEL